MNQKNSLGLNSCFMDLNDPIHLFDTWMEEAKKTEPNDPNAVALATSSKNNVPSVRMVLLKDFNQYPDVKLVNYEFKIEPITEATDITGLEITKH